MSSREQRKREARERRQAAEQAAAATAQRRRRLQMIAIAAAVAVVVVVVAVVVSSGGSGGGTKVTAGKPASGGAEVASQYQGIPQSGTTIGKPSAPVTLVQYVDLKCPACQAYELSAFPTILSDYVKTGKVRVESKVQHIVGDEGGDSEDAARMALASAEQNKFYPFATLFYRHQGNETEEYVTDSFLKSIGSAVSGLNVSKAMAARDTPKVTDGVNTASQAFDDNGFTGTPSFQIGTTGGALKTFNPSNFTDPKAFTSEFDKLAPGGAGA